MKKLSFRKAYNLILLRASYWLSVFLKKSIHFGHPASLSVEPTTSCNLNCLQCPTGLKTITRKQGSIDTKLYKRIINENYKSLIYLIIYFQGEPFLYNDIFELIREANRKKIYTATSTNGHFLTDGNCEKMVEAGLDKLIVSVDGTDQKTYEKYRIGGELKKVIHGIEKLIEIKRKRGNRNPEVEIQFLVTRNNQEQVGEMKLLADEIGVDKFTIKTAQIYDFENGNDLIPTIDKYSRYKMSQDGTYFIKNKMKNHCWRMWSSAVITWDGVVLPCCFDKDGQYVLGDINDRSLYSVWRSGHYHSFRNRILKSRRNIEMCKNCTEGLSR